MDGKTNKLLAIFSIFLFTVMLHVFMHRNAVADESVANGAQNVAEELQEAGKETGAQGRDIGKSIGRAFRKAGRATGDFFRKGGREIGKDSKKLGKEVGKAFRDILNEEKDSSVDPAPHKIP